MLRFNSPFFPEVWIASSVKTTVTLIAARLLPPLAGLSRRADGRDYRDDDRAREAVVQFENANGRTVKPADIDIPEEQTKLFLPR